MSDKYEAVKAKFKDGDWVFGVGEHVGISIVFDHDTNNPQPFSYLNATNPDDFRLATEEEIKAANQESAGCRCDPCQITPHDSDCAVHNEPATPNGPCDCNL